MIEIRFHGRGGQGVVTACQILANALFFQGKDVQYFPEFGIERRGAPVRAFLRIDDKKIYLKQRIYTPDCVIVFSSSLLKEIDVISGLKPNGWLIINTSKSPCEFRKLGPFKIANIDAKKIAIKYGIGTKTDPIVNTVILGAVAKILGFPLELVIRAIQKKFKGVKNILAAKEAFEKVRWENE